VEDPELDDINLRLCDSSSRPRSGAGRGKAAQKSRVLYPGTHSAIVSDRSIQSGVLARRWFGDQLVLAD
jgi:hypothetical protein